MNRRRAVFLDMEGTLGGTGLGGAPDFRFYGCAIPAIRLINQSGLLAIVVTNQSHIARGAFTEDDFDRKWDDLRRELSEAGAWVDAVYCCPHHHTSDCACRKPRPGMLHQARCDHDLLLAECYVVGDVGAWDMQMARAAGCRAVLVRTGLGEGSLGEYRSTWAEIKPDCVARDALAAAEWIAERERERPVGGQISAGTDGSDPLPECGVQSV